MECVYLALVFCLQVNPGEKNVKVGTLIALMVAEGENWQQVDVPVAAAGKGGTPGGGSTGGMFASSGGGGGSSSSGAASGGGNGKLMK